MKKTILLILATFFATSTLLAGTGKTAGKNSTKAKTSVANKAAQKDPNLIAVKFRSFYPVTRNGRSAVIKVVPGKSYLIRASLKMDAASTNPSTALRFVIREQGKRGFKTMPWHKLTHEKFTTLSCIYTPSAKVKEAVIILKPRFTAEEKARCKDFSAVEVSEELDE